MYSRNGLSLRACASIALLTLIVALPSAQTADEPVKFSAVAINVDGMVARTGMSTLDLTITRWSTASERERLLGALIEKGPEKLLSLLQDMRSVGSIRTPNSLAYDLRKVRASIQFDDEKRRTDHSRDGSLHELLEVANRPRSFDYPFTLIELRINRRGEGEGKMSIATKIVADKQNNAIVLENYGTPVMLNQVTRHRLAEGRRRLRIRSPTCVPARTFRGALRHGGTAIRKDDRGICFAVVNRIPAEPQ